MVPRIFKGDDTDANGRTVEIQLPDEDMAGFRMRFEFLGRAFEFDELPRSGSVRVDFGADDTAMFPLGTHYGTIRLQKDGRWHTVSNTVPVTVSDEVGAVYGGDASAIHLELKFHSGIPDLTGVNDSPANANELAGAFKALLDALKGAPGTLVMSALAFCMCAFGEQQRLSVRSAPIGEVAFASRVVTNVTFDAEGLATNDDVDSKVSAATNGLATAAEVESKADKSALEEHVTDTNNPHAVTAEQVGALPLSGGTVRGSLVLEAEGGIGSPTLEVSGVSSRGIKLNAEYGGEITVGYGSNGGGQIVLEDSSVTGGVEAEVTIGTVKVRSTLAAKADTTNVYTKAEVDAKVENSVLPTNPSFSNAVLSVGLNIDTNSVAVLGEIAETFGGFPIEGTATTVGGLLAALAAAVAWLKKNKVGSFESVGGATATVENGVAKLDDFFTNSNSLLTTTIDARLPYPLYAVTSTGLLKDRAINTTSLSSITVPDNFTDLLVRASVASSLSVTMPEAITTKYGDTFPGETGEYLITITKTGAEEAYVRTIKLEEVA